MTAHIWELYRVITDEDALLEACIDRADDLNVSRITIDEAGGFTPGYSAKLLCNPPMKTMVNESLTKMLKALGLALIAVVDDERFAGTKAQLSKRKKKVRAVARIKRVKGFFTKENASIFAKKKWARMSEKERSRHARRMNKARWQAERKRLRAASVQRSLPCPQQPIAPHAAPVNVC